MEGTVNHREAADQFVTKCVLCSRALSALSSKAPRGEQVAQGSSKIRAEHEETAGRGEEA